MVGTLSAATQYPSRHPAELRPTSDARRSHATVAAATVVHIVVPLICLCIHVFALMQHFISSQRQRAVQGTNCSQQCWTAILSTAHRFSAIKPALALPCSNVKSHNDARQLMRAKTRLRTATMSRG
nr:unnamed protein product [Leishmania braziliensis]